MVVKKTFHRIIDIKSEQTSNPIFAFRPFTLLKTVKFFQNHFKGDILYAVKTNPEPHIISHLVNAGIHKFDVASLQEVILIKEKCPGAEIYFMHPVKSRYAIKEAYHHYAVRHFSLDTEDELRKILEETNHAKDLCLHLRLAIPNTFAELSLAEKFGIDLQHAPQLLQMMKPYANKVGICFHVGSQCMHPDAYRIAIRIAAEVIEKAGIPIHYFNVGGGFPSVYPGMMPPPINEYFRVIHDELRQLDGYQKMRLLSEPGRALVAESTSLIVRVELRKGNKLYINDGIYGSLFDAGLTDFIFPTRLISSKDMDSTNLMPFSFYGPTCDSLDYMKGPFYLPEAVKEGDYIEIGQMGAYGRTFATSFNGFTHEQGVIEVIDEPLMSMYTHGSISKTPLEIIAA